MLAQIKNRRLNRLRKSSDHVIPKGRVCPRNLLFLGRREEKQIPRYARFTVNVRRERDDKKYLFRRLKPAPPAACLMNCGFPCYRGPVSFHDEEKWNKGKDDDSQNGNYLDVGKCGGLPVNHEGYEAVSLLRG